MGNIWEAKIGKIGEKNWCGLRGAGYGLRVAGCELRVAGFEVQDASCGLRVASCRVAGFELLGFSSSELAND